MGTKEIGWKEHHTIQRADVGSLHVGNCCSRQVAMAVEGKAITDRSWYPWFICAMSFTVQFVGMSFHGSFGPLYVKMLRHFQERDTKTAWVASISFAISLSISPVTYRLSERIGQRNSMIIASTLFGSSLFISSFATSLDVLFFTIGILLAVGLSFCKAASIFVLPHYFEKNYVLALGISISGGSLGSLAFSSIKGYIFAKFSYQTGMQLLASTSIILFLCGLTFKHPQKRVFDKEQKPINDERDADDDDFPPLSRNKSFHVLLLASLFYHIMYLFSYVHLTRLAIDFGVSDAKAALLPGILSLSESVGKVTSGRIISCYNNMALHVFQAAWVGMSLSSFACPFAKGFAGLSFYAICYGFCFGNACGSCVPVINHVVGKKRLVRGYSIFLFGLSPAVLAGPPLAGWLRETTLSYDAAFYTAGATVAFASALLFVVKLLHKAQRQEYLEKGMKSDEIEEADSVTSKEPVSLLSEHVYIIEKCGKSALMDLIENEVTDQKFSEQPPNVKVTGLNSFYYHINDVHWQRYFDISKETSL